MLNEIVSIRAKEIFLDICSKENIEIIEMEVMDDHIHLLLNINPYIQITKSIERIRGISSKKLRDEFIDLRRLRSLWTNSYFISTVGSTSLEVVKNYILNQKS